MARRRTVISQLASAGEEALGQLAQNPVTRRALEGAMQVRDRVEKLVTGLADIDGRVARIEKRLDALEKTRKSTGRRASTHARRSSERRPSAPPATEPEQAGREPGRPAEPRAGDQREQGQPRAEGEGERAP